MAQQSARRGRKNQVYSSCLEHAFMIWFRPANSHTGPQLHRCTIRGRTDGSIRLCADLLQKSLASRGASTDEYTPQNGAKPLCPIQSLVAKLKQVGNLQRFSAAVKAGIEYRPADRLPNSIPRRKTRHFAVVERELFTGILTVAVAIVPAGRGAVCRCISSSPRASNSFLSASETVR